MDVVPGEEVQKKSKDPISVRFEITLIQAILMCAKCELLSHQGWGEIHRRARKC